MKTLKPESPRNFFASIVPDVCLDRDKIPTHYFYHQHGKMDLVILTTDGGYSLAIVIGVHGKFNGSVFRVCNNALTVKDELPPNVAKIANEIRREFIAGKRILTGTDLNHLTTVA